MDEEEGGENTEDDVQEEDEERGTHDVVHMEGVLVAGVVGVITETAAATAVVLIQESE